MRPTNPCRPSVSMLVLAVLAIGFLSRAASANEPFPDEWFYSEADRPAELRGMEGEPMPELTLAEWIGDEVDFDEWKGDVIVVDFWATWCGPCMQAIPKNIELVKKYESEGLRFIGVHDSRNGWNRADQVVQSRSINYPVAKDDAGASVKAFNLKFWPTYVVVDRAGDVRAAGLKPNKVEDVVQALLAEPRPSGSGPAEAGGAEARVAEFPIDWFDGGERRLATLAAIEGKAAPKIAGNAAFTETGASKDVIRMPTSGRVTVVHFVAGWSGASARAMPTLARDAARLSKEGVDVVFVADHKVDARGSTRLLTGVEETWIPRLRFLVDTPPAAEQTVPVGQLTHAYGVRIWPTTIVVDRAGRVRAAGLKAERVGAVVERLMAERLESPAG